MSDQMEFFQFHQCEMKNTNLKHTCTLRLVNPSTTLIVIWEEPQTFLPENQHYVQKTNSDTSRSVSLKQM